MQANDLLKCRNKVIDAFKNGIFLSEYLKKSDNAGYNYVLKDVKDFIQKIESMSEKINLKLFKDFFELSSPADHAKMLINTSSNENKKNCSRDKRQNIRFKRQNKKISETEK